MVEFVTVAPWLCMAIPPPVCPSVPEAVFPLMVQLRMTDVKLPLLPPRQKKTPPPRELVLLPEIVQFSNVTVTEVEALSE